MSKRHPKDLILPNLTVTDAAAQGKSVSHSEDGRAVLITGAVPGDVVDVRVTKKKSKYYEGTVERIISPSEKRVAPMCEHFGVCGGCKWQNMAYQDQIFYKQKEVENNIRRIGNIEPNEIVPIKGCEKQYFYRNKMEYSFASRRWYTREELNTFGDIEGEVGLGFHIQGRWDKVLDVKKCFLQRDPSNDIRLKVRSYAIENGLTFFDPRENTGFLRTMMIRTSESTGEVMVMIQFYHEDVPAREGLLNFIKDNFSEVTSLLYAINPKSNDSLYDLDIKTFYGNDHIFEEMEGLRFKIGPKSFYQTNSTQAYQLYSIVRDFAQLTGNENVYDLYTGTGTISQFISKNAKKVIGVEAVPEAIEAAKINAQINGITNCEYLVGDMKDVFDDAFVSQYGAPDVVITDPPRDGMHKDVVAMLLKLAPKRIVYVSCNSATQGRDLDLMRHMYSVEKMQAVDMFPQTFHVENVAILTLKTTE
ncbi:MAG: 23S rRNA (uracil(1939)-C(5))-methyltransferase RlmD [Flavobacteriales bacterium]|nr:23S rRNA (uracil(1939)-C(5))-methyltransferase RlmD [Flavobacteriales bacterium]